MGRHPAKKRKYARDTKEGQAAKMEVKSDQKTAKVKTSDRHFSNRDYGRLVWGKIAGSRTWPGIIVPHYECGVRAPSAERVWIFWFGDNRVSQVPLSKLSSFKENFGTFYVCARIPKFQTGITVCIQELQHQSGLPQGNSEEALRQWANEGFPNAADYKRHAAVPFSSKVVKYLGYIKKAKNLGGHSSDSSDSLFPVTSSSSSDSDSSDADERRKWRPKASFLKLARQGKYDIEQLCIACHRTDCQIVAPHPYFVGSVCKICETDLDENSKDMEAGLNVRCVVCASPGKLLICDSADCERVFCFGCVELLVAPSAVNRILRASPWYCFLCEPFNPCTHGLLKPRPEWREMNPSKKPASWMSNFEEEVPDPSSFPKKPLRVLSVFDGIATGLVALDKLGLEVEVYYSCEVDEKATTVVASNFGSRVTLLGKVEELTEKKVNELCPIDLFIGGSPCNDLSFVNPKRKGLFDFSGTGYLFFYFYKILNIIQRFNKEVHLFWMFENVKHMPHIYREQISFFLEKPPIVIDARYFSPQSRPRCFWGNIPDW
ncbi:DNA (cytosine-5)-methyltransferase 3A-like isoform X1 [Scylla paramamosain]